MKITFVDYSEPLLKVLSEFNTRELSKRYVFKNFEGRHTMKLFDKEIDVGFKRMRMASLVLINQQELLNRTSDIAIFRSAEQKCYITYSKTEEPINN